MSVLKNSKVLVLGSSGFLGRHLVKRLESEACTIIKSRRLWCNSHKSGYVYADLTSLEETASLFEHCKPDFVFNLAGANGGVSWNVSYPFDIFAQNTQMAANLLTVCIRSKPEKILSVLASCAYGDAGQYPRANTTSTNELSELDFLDGQPNSSIEGHGYAKRNLFLASKLAKRQHGLDAICVCPPTLYGPGMDYHPERAKLVGALIKKFVDAKRTGAREVSVWGSGNPLRELMYVEDAADLIVRSMTDFGDCYTPLNLASPDEISVTGLAHAIARMARFDGKILFEPSRPDGQYRKKLSPCYTNIMFGEYPFTSLRDGLEKTIADYERTTYGS